MAYPENERELFMREALSEAAEAYALNEVPVGCVIVCDGKIIGRGHNRRITDGNVLSHAELTALGKACESTGDWRLDGCDIYVTVEPCPMCAGAIIQARIKRLFFGAANPKAGCAGSVMNILQDPGFNHRTEIISGILETECSGLMTGYFREFRSRET